MDISGFQVLLRRGYDGYGSRFDDNSSSDADWYITSRAILPNFEEVASDDENVPPTKRRTIHLNDLPGFYLYLNSDLDRS